MNFNARGAAVFGFCAALHIGALAQTNHPNVLFIAVDDLRPEIGAYGSLEAKTPNIDELAATSYKFNRAYVSFPLCQPSRATMLSGLRMSNNRMPDGSKGSFDDQIEIQKTWPALFKKAGYWTATTGKVYHGNAPHSERHVWDVNGGVWTHGNDWSEEIVSRIVDSGGRPEQLKQYLEGGYNLGSLAWASVDGGDLLLTDGMVRRDFRDYIYNQRDQDRPFMIAIGFSRPHLPWIAPRKYFEMYLEDAGTIASIPEGHDKVLDPTLEVQVSNGGMWNEGLTNTEAKRAIRAYLASTSYVDAQIGKVIEYLKQTGVYNNTIIILWGDHGYFLTEHGLFRKGIEYDKSLRHPLMIHLPGQKDTVEMNQVVESVDIYPTLLDLAGIQKPADVTLDGNSMAGIMSNPTARWDNEAFVSGKKKTYGYVNQDIHFSLRGRDHSDVRMYNLKEDPGEWADISDNPKYATWINSLRERVKDAWNLEDQ
ncbi:MAG: hypothetical protein DRR42_03665 [Gammaproteobacteria bacterium]|nr:MAG: hypothetical protein DRR42_03665 [Gammaproteobacteria bacterium]